MRKNYIWKVKIFNLVLTAGVALREVVLVGFRNPGGTAVQTSVPMYVIDFSEHTAAVPQVDLNQIFNFVASFFSSNTQTTSDGTSHIM